MSKYCYENSDVLINKLNIYDPVVLAKKEMEITFYKLSILNGEYENYINQSFDINHYLNIHKFLFEDIYPFAGEIRTENIYKPREPYGKGLVPFCEVPFIYNQLRNTLSEMDQNYIKINNKEDLVKFLGHYFLELNIIHPFREGNGRTLSEFMKEYVDRISKTKKLNLELSYKMDEDTRIKCRKATRTDNEALAYDIFDRLIKEKELNNEKGIIL